jgi:capsular polysaccharide biosynthesis protein
VEPYRERIEDFMRRWRSRYEGDRVFRVLVITVVLAALGATSAGLQQTPTYEASARMLVDEQQEDRWTNSGGSGEQIQTLEYREPPTLEMAQAIDSRPVAEETLLRLGLQTEPADLLDNLSIEEVEGTQFIRLTYESTDPVKATKIVNTVGEVASEFAARSGTLTATVFEEAMVPESLVSPHPLRNGLLMLVICLVFCAGTALALPGVGARVAGTLGERPTRQGVGLAGALRRRHRDSSIVERVKEKKLLLALGRRGKLTAIEAALETELSVEEANRMLQALALQGQLEVTVEHGKLSYSFWGYEAP